MPDGRLYLRHQGIIDLCRRYAVGLKEHNVAHDDTPVPYRPASPRLARRPVTLSTSCIIDRILYNIRHAPPIGGLWIADWNPQTAIPCSASELSRTDPRTVSDADSHFLQLRCLTFFFRKFASSFRVNQSINRSVDQSVTTRCLFQHSFAAVTKCTAHCCLAGLRLGGPKAGYWTRNVRPDTADLLMWEPDIPLDISTGHFPSRAVRPGHSAPQNTRRRTFPPTILTIVMFGSIWWL